MTCTICGGSIEAIGDWTDGNNAAPFPGRSCNDCDARFVTPARMMQIERGSDLIPILREFARLGRINSLAAEAVRRMQRSAEAHQHRDDGRGVCIDCGEFLPTSDGEHWS